MKKRLLFIVESGTDVRLVEGFAESFNLSIIARKIEGGVEISQPTSARFTLTVGPSSRARFAAFVFFELLRRQHQTDIVVVQGYSLAALAANAARQVTGVPTVMLVCSPIEAYYRCRLAHPGGTPYRRQEAAMIDLLARMNALMGDSYVVLSEYLRFVIQKYGGQRICKIPVYGIDTSIFRPPVKSRAELKAELDLPLDGTLVFFSSRIAPEKDSETLLRAIRRLLDSGENLWLLHRSGGYRQFLADAKAFGVNDRVIATDAVHPHHGLALDYQACDVCVQASRKEGLGFSPLEALACETPVVATRVGGLKETIVDGQTGWTYTAGDDAALAACLKEVIANPGEARRRAENGRRKVQEEFERYCVFQQFEDLAETLILRSGKNLDYPIATQSSDGSLAIERSGSETAQVSVPDGLSKYVIRLLRSKHTHHNASIMAERTIFALFGGKEEIGVDQNGPASQYDPLAQHIRHKDSSSGRRSLDIVIAIHTPRDPNTAVFKNTHERAVYLESRGHRCTIITPEDFPILRRISSRFLPLVYPIVVARWLARRKETKVALFHSYAGWAVASARKYLKAFPQLRMAIVFHGLEPLYYSRLKQQAESAGSPLSWRYRFVHGFLIHRLLRSSTRKADVLICLNSEEARFLLENDWASSGRVTVLENPAPTKYFIQRHYHQHVTQLLFVGQWLPMKGTKDLVEAFSRLRHDFPDLRLCCAGTRERESIVLEAFPPEVRQAVTVHPTVSTAELLDLHRSADIFALPTLSEGFSLALVEAMASGLPIVTTTVGAAPDILTHQKSALLVPPNNCDKVVDAISMLIRSHSLRESLGHNAQLAADSLRPEYALREFGVCFELLAQLHEVGDNELRFSTASVRGS